MRLTVYGGIRTVENDLQMMSLIVLEFKYARHLDWLTIMVTFIHSFILTAYTSKFGIQIQSRSVKRNKHSFYT